jgi:hypothetical protein
VNSGPREYAAAASPQDTDPIPDFSSPAHDDATLVFDAVALRNWSVPTTTATHVRFVVRDNQCTGQPSYHGDQDDDQQNNSDCRVGDPGGRCVRLPTVSVTVASSR